MRKHKLCAMLIAVLGANSLTAQTDVTSTYLKNPSFEYSAEGTKYSVDTKELANGEAIYGWTGATISNSNKNIQVTKTAPNTAFGTTSASDGDYYYFIRQGWEDKTSSIKQTVSLPEGRYYLAVDYKQAEAHDNGKFRDSKVGLTITKGEVSLATLSTGGSVNAPGGSYFTSVDWKQIGTWFDVEETSDVTIALTFVLNGTSKRSDLCLDNVKLYKWDLEDQTNYDNAARTNPMDVTAKFVTNPYFDANTNGWTSTTGAQNRTRAVNQAGAISGGFFENWNPSSIASGKIYQTLSGLIDGIYRVTISAYGTQGTPKLKVYAGGSSVDVTSETPLNYSVETTVSGNGSLEIGLEVQSGNGSKWIGIDNVKLEYLGYDLTAANEQLTQMISDAQTIVSANEAAPKAIENLTNAIAAAQSVEQNKNAIQTASTTLAAAIDAAEVTVAPYAKAMTLLSICESILANSEDFENGAMDTFSAALYDAKTAIEAAATADAINNEYNTLEAARQTYVVKADPTNGTYFDYTFKINNPAVVNGDGWTGARTNSGEQYTGAPDNTYWDSWNGSGQNIYQEIADLPSGLYTLKAAGRAVESCTSAYIYLNDTKVEIEKKGSKGNDLGNGWKWFTTEKTAVAGTAKIGFACNTGDSKWAGADDFHLYYYGFDVTTAQNSVATLKTEAEALVGKAMNADVATALTAAINGADASKTTRNELNPMISVLDAAVGEAEASIAEYELIRKYIDKAKVFDEDDTDLATLETQYTNGVLTMAEPVRQALNVWTYNYVATNFKNEIAVTEWTGTMGTLNGQHWDGTEATSYYDGASWQAGSHTLSASVSLTAGDYVFRAAGRSSAVSVLTLTVQGQTITFNAKGDKGYGIDTNGKANFSNEGTYANNNAGRGWEWEFVKFSLSETTTVVLEASSTYNGGWASFANIGLWMDDATYVQANVGALAESLEVAKVLVDTKPMGAAENEALKEAVVQGEAEITTPAQLDAAIAALNTSVENANKWVAAYNEAKAPLVAAIELFESKYNDGENGCLYEVDETAWSALIAEVTTANEAKNVTDDYSGFAPATESFNAALAIVDASIMAIPTNSKKSATASDMTNYYLVNASFDEGDTNGWAKTGSQTNNVAWSVTDGTFKATPSGSHYTGDAIWQEVTLPKGAYKLSVNVNAEEVKGHQSSLFAATSAPTWDNKLTGLLASTVVEKYNEDVTLTCIFSLSEETTVYVGFNQTAGNRANTGIQGSYTIYDFILTQAANQIFTKDGVITVVGENEAADLAGISSDENIVKVDLTGAIWSEASTLNIVNKNSLVYVTDDTDLTANNIVKVGVDEEGNTTRVAESIVLTEGYKFAAREAFTATALNYAREFSANWLTVCLPFAYEIPENVKVETLGAVDLDTKTFTFNEVTGTMGANKPYIIKNSSETAALFAELGDVAVEATPEAMTIKVTADNSEHEAEFIGTYTAVKTDALMEDGVYDILFFGTDGQLYYLSQGTTEKVVNIKPFRAYIRLPKGAINWSDGQQAIARHGEGTTDIEDAELTNEGAPAIYDLMGRKVTSMEKDGMYIVNGKKVIVK